MKTSKIASIITIFNLTVTPLIFLPNQSIIDNYIFPKHMVILICSILFILQIWLSRKNLQELFVWDKPTKTILIYLAIISISLLFAINPLLSLSGNTMRQEGFATIIMYVLMFFAARASKQLDWKVYAGMLTSATIIALYGIFQRFGVEFFQLEPTRLAFIPYGTIGNQNFFGTFLVLMIPFSAHFWYSKSKKIALLSYGILLFCLIATMSRGPWLGAIGAMSSYLILRFLFYKDILFFKKSFILFLVTLGTILIYFSLFGNSIFSRFFLIFTDFTKIIIGDPASSSAGSSRWFIWMRVIHLIQERPIFGYGISNLSIVFKSRYSADIVRHIGSLVEIDEAHNEYLDIAVSSGIPSLIAYLYFLYSVTIKRLRKPGILNDFNLPMLTAVFGYSIQAFFNISTIRVFYIFWIFLGLLTQNMLINKTNS